MIQRGTKRKCQEINQWTIAAIQERQDGGFGAKAKVEMGRNRRILGIFGNEITGLGDGLDMG